MTPHPATAHLTLDPATTDATLATIFGALRRDPERTPAQHHTLHQAGVAMIASLQPRDPTEAAYATRAAAAHYGSMECFRRALLPDVPDTVAIRLHGKAESLSRMNKDMVRTLKDCQAEAPPVQRPPQPAARPAIPPPPVRPEAARLAALTPAKPTGTQDPMSSERTTPAPAAPRPATPPQPTPTPATRPAVIPPRLTPRYDFLFGRQNKPKLTVATLRAQLAAALAAKPTGRQHPMSSERPSYTPSPHVIMTGPAATSFRSAPPPRQTLRTTLLGTTADIDAMVAAENLEATLHVQ
jgi:hypothetical protein